MNAVRAKTARASRSAPASGVIAAVAAAAFGVLSACGPVAKATRPVATAAGEVLLSDEDERQIGAQLAAQVRQKEKVLEDPAVLEFVGRVGRRIVEQVPEDERRFPFELTVLDAPGEVNAFALPGGYLFVYSGLIAAVPTEAELASVLAHEVAHVARGHVSQALAAQVGLQALASLALGKDPGLLAQLAAAVAAQGYLAAYSRDTERDADQAGLALLARAGYDPYAMPRFFELLDQMAHSRPGAVQAFFASHPAPADRAGALKKLIRERGYGPGSESLVGGLDAAKARLK